jgi:hypothetical protein
MLILPKESMLAKENELKANLIAHYNGEMERILNENSTKEVYWILGKVRFPEEFGGKVGRTFLEASDTKPPLIKNAFLYEVDNRRGTKTILWVMNPDGSLRIPLLNKTIKATPAPRAIIRA